MSQRSTAPAGEPCWTDLWTSDVEGSRRFYGELLGWEALEPNPEFGGYFMWTRDGVPVAGGMGGMPGMAAQDIWKVYFAVADLAGAVKTAESEGAVVSAPPMAVADLGSQAVLVDPTGAFFGLWQAGSFFGFAVVGEPGGPGWFELQTADRDRATAFYETLLAWQLGEPPGGRAAVYTTVRPPSGDRPLVGVRDASGLIETGASRWVVCWQVEDTDDAAGRAERLGGSLLTPPESTPIGRLATVADPAGATFGLRAAG